MSARVAIVVLNYLNPDDTLRCVRSVQNSEYRNSSLIVVDNGSGLRVLDTLRGNLDPVIPVIANEENLGFAAGNNVGIRKALGEGAEFVWVLNPDTVVAPDTLLRMVGVMRRYPQAGVVGTRILNGGSLPPTIWFNGGIIDWESEGATTHRDIGKRHEDVDDSGIMPADYVTGASMLVRRAVFDEVGEIPEDYFLYFEETDFCTRARKAGWANLVDSEAIVWHYRRSAMWTPAPYYVYYFCRGRLLFRDRFFGGANDHVPPDLTDFIEAWRKKVTERAPDWVETYDRLVAWAVADGLSGVRGRRDDISAVPSAQEMSA